MLSNYYVTMLSKVNLKRLISISNIMCRLGTILNCVTSSQLKLFLQGMTSTGYRKEIKLIRRGVITFFIVSF